MPPPAWRKVGQSRWPDELKRVWVWFEEEGGRWGESWENCAWGFLGYEEASGFPYEQVRLPKGPRAGLGVDSWIACGRKLGIHPCLPDAEEIRRLFWKWWRGMQPKERLVDDGVLSRAADIDWAVLRDYSGKNGLLQVMMVLGWWGNKVHNNSKPELVAEWETAVDDVRWVFDAMVKEGMLSKYVFI
jgi:hypothetical protein